MPEVHGGLQARVRREERRFGYGERCRTRFRARADGCAATNPWIELPGHHQDRHPDRRAGSRGQYRARSPELGGGTVSFTASSSAMSRGSGWVISAERKLTSRDPGAVVR